MITTPEPCPICGDTGWQTVERGKEREVVRCECRVKDRTERLLAAARIPVRYEHCEFSTFDIEGKRETLRRSKQVAEQFVDKYPLEKRGLVFVGRPGVGKT
ncbi:MAG: DNA replication protein DnaC, partial [Candidatus Korobacteraceae bacterium]